MGSKDCYESSETSIALYKKKSVTKKKKRKIRTRQVENVSCIYNQQLVDDCGSTNKLYVQRSPFVMKSLLKGKGKLQVRLDKQQKEECGNIEDRKVQSRSAKWPETHNQALSELLLEQFTYGNMVGGVIRKEVWTGLVASLNRRCQSSYTEQIVSIRFKNMKADFRTYQLSNRSGWSWDNVRHVPLATDEIWQEIAQENPKLAKFRRKPFHQYEIFERICGENVATGAKAMASLRDKGVESDQDITIQDVGEDDDFMRTNGVTYTEDYGEFSVPTDMDNSMMQTSNKQTSTESIRVSKKKSKKKANKSDVVELLHKHIETGEKIQRSLDKDNEYAMTPCLRKLGDIPNISTAGILAVQDALKEAHNRSIFMMWDSESIILKTWIENVVASHPIYYASPAWI